VFGDIINLMKILKNKKVIILVLLTAVLLFIFMVNQWLYLRKAHSTFENYYAFRGCIQLLEKTEDYGICKTNIEQTIKIVKYQDKWYLEGDLPWACLGRMCFGI
jgi:hypothetical protein